MNYCSNCGNEVKEGQAICLGCGFALQGNSKPTASAAPMIDVVLTDRVEHDVFKMMPAFDGPIGRMEYFKSLAKLVGISLVMTIILSVVLQVAGSGGLLAIPMLIIALLSVAVFVQLVVQQTALTYKRIWDLGVNDNGARVGWTLGVFIITMIPLLNLAILALFFIPGRR